MKDGTVRCWGDDTSGQLGGGSRLRSVEALTDVVDLAAGWFHTCALKADKTVVCWGGNEGGQLGADEKARFRSRPAEVSALRGQPVVKLVASGLLTCALFGGGKLPVCFGTHFHKGGLDMAVDREMTFDERGFCGIDATNNVRCTQYFNLNALSSPAAIIGGLTDVVSLATAWTYGFAVKQNGDLVGWGYLSDGCTKDASGVDACSQFLTIPPGQTPCANNVRCDAGTAPWAGVRNAKAIVMSGTKSDYGGTNAAWGCVLYKDGTVGCFGHNDLGQLGNGTVSGRLGAQFKKPQLAPTPVANVRKVVQLAVGDTHACALTETGEVLCWGENPEGSTSPRLGTNAQKSGMPPLAAIQFAASAP
jgi:alpha-tubulin suppressor-like RCC1 family protein